MIKACFSTVACHDWTLDQVSDAAGQWGAAGVELRTSGSGAHEFACDPALTSEDKTRPMLARAGVEPVCLATPIRFDQQIRPPVIGRVLSDCEASVREAKWAIDLAGRLGCPYVRVFGYEFRSGEKRGRAMERIVSRLEMALDHARNTGVRLVIENGGSFQTAAQISEIIDRAASPLLGASYSMAVAFGAGEDPQAGVNVLGDKLWVAKVKDSSHGRPVALGQGDLPCEDFVRALSESGFAGPVVFEWDRAWVPGLEEAAEVVPGALARITQWSVSTPAPMAAAV